MPRRQTAVEMLQEAQLVSQQAQAQNLADMGLHQQAVGQVQDYWNSPVGSVPGMAFRTRFDRVSPVLPDPSVRPPANPLPPDWRGQAVVDHSYAPNANEFTPTEFFLQMVENLARQSAIIRKKTVHRATITPANLPG